LSFSKALKIPILDKCWRPIQVALLRHRKKT